MNTPYTYLIGWPEYNRWYYGVRYAKNCTPDDFWVSYFTSSNIVKNFITQHGDPSVKIIRKIFTGTDSVPRARSWESRVLQRLKVMLKEEWLNNNDSPAPPIIRRFGDDNIMRRSEQRLRMKNNNPVHRKEVREKISKSNTGKPATFTGTHSDETKKLMKQKWQERKQSNWTAPRKTDEQKKYMSEKLKGCTPNPDAVAKMKNTININGSRKGANNPAAKPLIFRGVEYSYIREAVSKTGLSAYKILKECEFIK